MNFLQRTRAHFPIERVYASGVNPDEHFAFFYSWTWRIFVPQDFRSAVIVNSDCLHKIASATEPWLAVQQTR